MKRTLLVDVDSTIPNLALMHISTWKKNEGHQVGFNISNPTEVYASCIFQWNRHKIDGLRTFYPEAMIDVGGSGVDLYKSLPEEVNKLMPDYSLYPSCDYDLGFTSRGCPNNCHFCIVPKKEGSFKINQHPKEFHDPTHKKIVLMDNNILANKNWFFEVTDWIIENKLKVDFNQGLDLRRVDYEIAERIAKLHPINYWRFAFDSLTVSNPVRKGLDILKESGVNIRNKAIVYVYVNDDSDFSSALKRCEILKGIGTVPYPMFNRNAERTQRMTDLKRWARPWIFFSTDFKDYKRNDKGRGVRTGPPLNSFKDD